MPDTALPVFRLAEGLAIAAAQPPRGELVTPDSPALAVVTDLTAVRAATIGRDETLRRAEQAMIVLGVRMLFVVGELPALEGLVTSSDISGERPLRLVHERGLHHDEIRVADVMTPLAALDALDFARLQHATVGQLIATLRRHGRQHLLVVEQPAGAAPRRVRGIVSHSQIERQLGRPVEVAPIARSFAEIEQALA